MYDCTAPPSTRLRQLSRMLQHRDDDDRCVACELSNIAHVLDHEASMRAEAAMMDRVYQAAASR